MPSDQYDSGSYPRPAESRVSKEYILHELLYGLIGNILAYDQFLSGVISTELIERTGQT